MMDISLVFDGLTAIGSLATVGSLFWAVHVFKLSHDREEIATVKKAILSLPVLCDKLQRLLSEPVFSAIGNGIAEELEKYMVEGQSLEEFNKKFMLNAENDNYKALAIYMGMKKCNEIDEIDKVISSIEDCRRSMITQLPIVGRVISILSKFVTLPAERAITARILNNNLKYIVNGEDNIGLINMLEEAMDTGARELYFKRIALHLEGAISANLVHNSLGQDRLSIACKMISIVSKKFETLSEDEFKKVSKIDKKRIQSVERSKDGSTVIEAMELLKIHKSLFSEEEWDFLVEYKGRIVQLEKSRKL